MNPISVLELQAGRAYKVTLDDCCIQGTFTAMLSRIEKASDGWPIKLAFINGVTLTGYSGVKFEVTQL